MHLHSFHAFFYILLHITLRFHSEVQCWGVILNFSIEVEWNVDISFCSQCGGVTLNDCVDLSPFIEVLPP